MTQSPSPALLAAEAEVRALRERLDLAHRRAAWIASPTARPQDYEAQLADVRAALAENKRLRSGGSASSKEKPQPIRQDQPGLCIPAMLEDVTRRRIP
jgi:hypothetical protein